MTALSVLADSYRTGLLIFIAVCVLTCIYCVFEELALRKEMRK